MATLESAFQDLRFALRSLRRSPAFACAAVTTLALGIGANTAVFSLINATLFEPLPYPEPARIVQLWFTTPDGAGLMFSIPEFNLLTEQDDVFEESAAYDFGGPGVNIVGAGEPEQVKAIHVSRGYFRLFGAPLAAGRTFTAGEDRPGGARVAVISDALWMRRFNRDPSSLGRAISLGNEPYVVIGVLAPEFRPDPPADLWLPLQADPNSVSHAHYLRVAARLRKGTGIDQANARLKLAVEEFRRRFPLFNPDAGFQARPLRETRAGDLRAPLLVLFVTVALVLSIACSNVANLLLARGAARRREISVRAAVGASRRRLVRQLLAESLLLAVAGGAFGLALGQLCIRTLAAWNPGALPGAAPGTAVSLDWRVLAFTGAASLCAVVVFGLAPALENSRTDLVSAMKQGGARTGTGGRAARIRSILVATQVALAVLLVIGAGLMIRTFAALRQTDPGIDPQRILTFEISLRGTRFQDTAAVARLVEDAADRIRRLPAVIAAASSWTLPVELAFNSTFIVEGRPLDAGLVHGTALMRPVSPDYFSVFRIPLLAGRAFTSRDTAAMPGVAIVSQAMAGRF
ncbi:MAG: ABC transporter permease [Bryobacteraceae bacterium]|nr:ABC transporter permease [Bryobacteraceae bacterium]